VTRSATLDWLYGLELFGMKLGLENMRELCAELGSPEGRVPMIHVAGTNGKGSTAAMIASTLTEAGLRVGLYTSPHLVRFNERIRVGGAEIADDALERFAATVRPAVDTRSMTFFEATTAIAFLHFAERACDVAVIETGLGGRLDATNVITPLASVITSIGIDHVAQLGSTLASIASEKAGIIKTGVPVVSNVSSPEARDVIAKVAADQGSDLVDAAATVWAELVSESWDGLVVRLENAELAVPGADLPLAGRHQMANAQTAVAALTLLRSRFDIPARAVVRGFRGILRNTGLRARLESIVPPRASSPRVILDVAHNGMAMDAIADVFEQLESRASCVAIGLMSDKELPPIVSALNRFADSIIAVSPNTSRARPSADLARDLETAGCRVSDGGTVASGVRRAVEAARPGSIVLITGSHYVVGEALAELA
jgi:dihydrofolate synthase/folylpolyglutamate synthase